MNIIVQPIYEVKIYLFKRLALCLDTRQEPDISEEEALTELTEYFSAVALFSDPTELIFYKKHGGNLVSSFRLPGELISEELKEILRQLEVSYWPEEINKTKMRAIFSQIIKDSNKGEE